MWTTTSISHIFINKYHPLIISLFPGLLYITETRFVKYNLSFGNCLFFEVWSPFTTWKHGKTSHLKLLVNIHSWTLEVEVMWLNLPLVSLVLCVTYLPCIPAHDVWLSKWFSFVYPQSIKANNNGLMVQTRQGLTSHHPI